MEVTFRRTAERRYAVVVSRTAAPALHMHPAPGYDPLVPHDLAHFIVERECGIALGVFGQLAAGGDAATFHRVDGAVDRKLRRRGERLVRENRVDLAHSEQLVYRCMRTWRGGDRLAADGKIEQVCTSFDAVSERWQKLAVGESITLAWPRTSNPRRTSGQQARGRGRGSRDHASRRSRSIRR